MSLSVRLPCRLPSAFSAFLLPDTRCTCPQRYTTFDKSFYAGFALKVVEGAKLGDSICVRAFQKAGTDLGRHIVAVAPHITEPLRDAGLTVICTCFLSFRWASVSFRFSTGPSIYDSTCDTLSGIAILHSLPLSAPLSDAWVLLLLLVVMMMMVASWTASIAGLCF